MAFYVKKLTKSFKNQNDRKTCIFKFFPDSTHSQLISPGQHSTVQCVKLFTTPSNFTWNSKAELTKATPIYSVVNYHHWAKNILMCDIGYVANVHSKNFANDNKNTPALDKYMGDIKVNQSLPKAKLKQEIDRLRRKGVMKAIAIKNPEDIINSEQR